MDSNLARHLIETNHTCSMDKILHILDKGQKMNILEAYEIQKAIKIQKPILNDQVDLFQSNCFEFLLEKITNYPPPYASCN